mmetsp:Transcript_8649/g.18983  ORF Transcript_8649/g.18983 Transcript_8649/m.18983 type:complete len:590 (-) Transcript_8649:872-2641(-)
MCIIYLINQCKKRKANREKAERADEDNEGVPTGEQVNENEDVQLETGGSLEQMSKAPTATSMIDFKTQFGTNMFVVMMLGLSAALDFVMAMMSIQAFYYILKGKASLYGLAVGIYDLGQVSFAPIFSSWADKTKSYRAPFAMGIFLQMVGNLIYALLFYIQKENPDNEDLGWQLMIGARLIAGCGSAVLNLGSAYITTHTNLRDRFGALGSYRIWQSFARMVGPFVGFVFIGLPTPDLDSTGTTGTAEMLFNFYTIPGWVAVFFCFITLILLAFLFKDGVEGKDMDYDVQLLHSFSLKTSKIKPGSFLFGILVNTFVHLTFGFVNWALIFQFFGFGFAQFKVINQQTDIWKPYTALGAGSLFALYFWKFVTPKLGTRFPELIYSEIGAACIFAATFMFYEWSGIGVTEPVALMYVGSALTGLSTTWFFTNQEISYSKQLTWSVEEVGTSINRFMGLYGAIGAFARFLGPFVAGYAFAIRDTSGADMCVVSTCCLEPDNYQNATCEFDGSQVFVPILIAISFICLVLQIWYDRQLLSYPKELGKGEDVSEKIAQLKRKVTDANLGDTPRTTTQDEMNKTNEVENVHLSMA